MPDISNTEALERLTGLLCFLSFPPDKTLEPLLARFSMALPSHVPSELSFAATGAFSFFVLDIVGQRAFVVRSLSCGSF